MDMSLPSWGLRANAAAPAPAPTVVPEGVAQLFESNPNMMWISDAQTLRFLAVNDAALARYGFSRSEFLGMRLPDLLPPGERELIESTLDDAPGPRFLRNVPRIWRHVTRSGQVVLVEVARHPIVFRGRDARLAMVTDVTARLASEVRLRDEIEALKQQLDSMQGDVAAARQIAARSVRGNADARVLALAQLLDTLVVHERLDLSALAEHEVHLLRLADPSRRVHVEIEPGLEAVADEAMVRQLLRELLANAWHSNALRASPWIRVGRSTNAIEGDAFYVADNGTGFDEHAVVHGLGLSIAAAVVRRHRGRLQARSTPGQGATFLFTLGQAPTGT